ARLVGPFSDVETRAEIRGAHEAHEMSTRTPAPRADPRWIDAVGRRVRAQVADRALRVVDLRRPLVGRGESIVDGRDDEALRAELRAEFIEEPATEAAAVLPSAAVHVEDGWS